MTYKLIYPESYISRAWKFLKKHPEIHKQYRKTLELLELNPCHPSLSLHKHQLPDRARVHDQGRRNPAREHRKARLGLLKL